MKKLINWFKNIKYKKDIAIVAGVVLIGLLAVSGEGLSDLANKPFWWKFWSVTGIAALLTWIGGWVYFSSKNRSQNK